MGSRVVPRWLRPGTLFGEGTEVSGEAVVVTGRCGVQQRSTPGRAAESPIGTIGTSRFRRALAWRTARRPGGLVALAIQYGHMRTILDADRQRL
ncbi:hypothetical protein [Streptomyces sp. NPDC007100]|uniref:hypothetical protein n=1 Tax=Streptomyces sp. NPDC007100 TaxID=3155602 RepID=UPI00340827F1